MKEFEYDHQKSLSNLKKHGINFEEAQRLWDDPDLVEIPARLEDEPRFLIIGKLNGKTWVGVITYRRDRIRIISVRRASPIEEAFYES
ncbi:MAG: BrnT family toxin [Candidatus Omnitrophica bacterium]|nr:BrnT family toxin [Candidatus Omnitrophota bacterium]